MDQPMPSLFRRSLPFSLTSSQCCASLTHPSTHPSGGYFKVKFQFGADFPNQPPKCRCGLVRLTLLSGRLLALQILAHSIPSPLSFVLPGWFATKIFHPNVAPSSGEICVSTLKKDWKKEYGVGHIVSRARERKGEREREA